MRIKAIIICLLFLGLILLEGSMAFSQQVTINIVGEDLVVGIPGGIRTVGKMFTEKTGVGVNFIIVEASPSREKLVLDMMADAPVAAYDVAYLIRSYAGELVDGNYIVPLDEIAKELKPKTLPAIDQLWKDFTYKGHVYGIPREQNSWLFYYRTDLFKEAGLRPPKTYDEVLDFARKLTNPQKGIYGAVFDWRDDNLWGNFVLLLGVFGGKPFSDDLKTVAFNSEAGVKALEYMKKFLDAKLVTPDTPTIESSGVKARVFNSGIAAMTWNYAFQYGWAGDPSKSAIVGKWAATLMPGLGEEKSISTYVGSAYGVVRKAKNKREAIEWCKFLLTPEVQKTYAESKVGLPLLKDVYGKYEDVEIIRLLAEQGRHKQLSIFWTKHDVEIYKAFNRYWDQAMAGQIGIKEALDKAAAEANEILKK